MANEISVTSRLQYTRAGLNVSKTYTSQDDQTTFGRIQDVVSLTTGAAAIDTGGVSDAAWFLIHNLDTSATVSWGLAAGSQPFEVPPESSNGPVKLSTGQTIYAKTSAGTTYAEVTITER